MLYPAHLSHVLGHHGKVLVLQDGIDAQYIKSILLRLLAPVLPLLLLGPAEVVWRVHVAGLPFAVYLALVLGYAFGFGELARGRGAVETGAAGEARQGGGGRGRGRGLGWGLGWGTRREWSTGVGRVAAGGGGFEDIEDVFCGWC